MLATTAPAASARLAPPKEPSFGSAIENYADYMGQTLCSPTAKAGTQRLANLLRATYGYSDIGISRSCGDGGVSEHKEGRALDWMVSHRVKAQKQAAKSFLAWLLAPDADGNPAAMARRLGVMYIGWNNRMWRSYDPTRGTNGWDDLKGCLSTASLKDRGYDTYCHRNHVHLSLSWDGADGRTSFWTGKAMLTPDCARRTSPVRLSTAGSESDPATLLNTSSGKGIADGVGCRVGVDRWSGDDREVGLRVPMPDPVKGVSYGLKVRVDRYDSNAPGRLLLDTSATSGVAVAAGARLPYTTVIPVGADGVLEASVNAGQAFVKLTGLGLVTSGTADPPAGGTTGSPRVTLHTPASVVTSATISFRGKAAGVPSNAVVQRYLKVGKGQWAARGAPVAVTKGRWSTTTAAPSTAQVLKYRAGVLVNGKLVDRSRKKLVQVVTVPKTSLHVPATLAPGDRLVLTGKVKDVPAGTTVQRFLKVGSDWQSRGGAKAPKATGRWRLGTTAPSTPGKLRYRIAMWSEGKIIGWSKKKVVRIG
jgi:hypothetical protein